jgi:hypothetical protein
VRVLRLIRGRGESAPTLQVGDTVRVISPEVLAGNVGTVEAIHRDAEHWWSPVVVTFTIPGSRKWSCPFGYGELERVEG